MYMRGYRDSWFYDFFFFIFSSVYDGVTLDIDLSVCVCPPGGIYRLEFYLKYISSEL